ncbi:hypothetical protein HRbin06_00430 [archaeon HR06]|nr:hypothetical protein HRbin06_00430 [archaeon HR06]
MSLEEIVKQINSLKRVEEYDWQGLAKKYGWDFVMKVIEKLSPEAVPLMPKLPKELQIKGEEGYIIPDYHLDALWTYAQFLSMYRRLSPQFRHTAVEWLKDAFKNMPEAWR